MPLGSDKPWPNKLMAGLGLSHVTLGRGENATGDLTVRKRVPSAQATTLE